jgi:hypothetical protein
MEPIFHTHTKKQISNFISKPSHALGIIGDAGAGKAFAAQNIAASLLDVHFEKLLTHPYVKTLDCSDSSVGIGQIREAQQFLTLIVPGTRPFRRVLILVNIDSLGHEAQNALLKTLEETPTDTIIITTIARRNNVLPTIHSRLQQIKILPLSLDSAKAHFADKFNGTDIEKAFFISNGYAGLMSAILTAESEHPLVKAIHNARHTLGQSRYERMLSVESLVKNKDISSEILLDGLYRLLHASYKQAALKGRSKKELSSSLKRLHMVEQAAVDLESKVSEKLVLSRLLFNL